MPQSPSPELTHRRVLAISLPILLSNATIPLMGIVDTAVVGQLGAAAPIGAVGVGAMILTSIYWIFGFLRMGTTGLASQARGAGRWGEVTALLSRGLLIGLGAGAVFIIAQALIIGVALWFVPASDEVERLARAYLGIRIWGAPAAIASYAITGWLIAAERTKGVLALQLCTNLLNIGLSIFLGLELDWGVKGVATATLVSEWAGLLLGLWLCREAFASPAWRNVARIMDAEALRNMLMVNGDIMIRSVLLVGSFASITFLSASFGDVTLAANEVLINFLHFTAYALDGFAFAAEALVGKSMGAKNRIALRRAAKLCSLWGMIMAVVMAALTLAFGPYLIGVMAKSVPVQQVAQEYLVYVVLLPLLGMPAWMLDGIFIGATRSRDMRNASIQTTSIFALCLLATIPLWGNHGIWISICVLMLVRAAALGRYYPALERAAAT